MPLAFIFVLLRENENMSISKKSTLILLSAGALISGAAQATLVDRGGGLLYDDVLNVTWLQDANYAKTSGYSDTGIFDHIQATLWAANLTYFDSVRNVNFDDWRLPTVSSIGIDWNYSFSSDGSTDWGPNNTNPVNELSYMYFVNLGLKSATNPDGTIQPNFGVFGDGTVVGQSNVSSGAVTIENLHASMYWTSSRWYLPESGHYYWTFSTLSGETNAAYEYASLFTWAVRDGDVAPVASIPEPETYALTLLGLGLIGALARGRKSK